MATRKVFLGTAFMAAGMLAAVPNNEALSAAPRASSPTPKPTAPPSKPSPLARQLAASLQRDLPKANISDTLADKIASDIEDNFAINKAFRNKKNRSLPPPDFVFRAKDSEAS